MNILWAGGEDIDFPQIGSAVLDQNAGRFRSGWARGDISMATATGSINTRSNVFSGGTVTSCWLSYEVFVQNIGGGNNNSNPMVVLGSSAGGTRYVGAGTNTSGVWCLAKYDGTTRTVLASDTTSAADFGVLCRVDLQIVYAVSGSMTLYVNGVQLAAYTGDTTVSGMTNLDTVICCGSPGTNSKNGFSEIFVADSDTRAVLGLQTLALTGAGTTNNWTNNTFSNINGFTFSDNSPTSVNTTATDQQYTVTAPTPVAFSVIACSISGRLAKGLTSTPTAINLGYKNGATGAFGTGASKTVTTGYATYGQIDAINPTTGVAFTSTDLASLQLDIQSA